MRVKVALLKSIGYIYFPMGLPPRVLVVSFYTHTSDGDRVRQWETAPWTARETARMRADRGGQYLSKSDYKFVAVDAAYVLAPPASPPGPIVAAVVVGGGGSGGGRGGLSGHGGGGGPIGGQ